MSIVTVRFGAIDAPDSGIKFRVGSDEIPAGVLYRVAVINVQIEGIGCSLKCFGLAAYRIGSPAPAVIAEAVGHNHPHIAEGKVDTLRGREHIPGSLGDITCLLRVVVHVRTLNHRTAHDSTRGARTFTASAASSLT